MTDQSAAAGTRPEPQPAGAGSVIAQISWRGTASHQYAPQAPTVTTAPQETNAQKLARLSTTAV